MSFECIKNIFSSRASKRGVVLTNNWGNVLTGDIKGNVVIVNGEQFPLSLHIPKLDDPVPENIGSMLTWRSRIPSRLYGRDSEINELIRWCEEPHVLRVRILHGEGGAGKTRLAFEVAEALRSNGWEAGQLLDPMHATSFRASEIGTLLIVDYPEQHPAAIDKLLRALRDGEPGNNRIRILFLSRNVKAIESNISEKIEAIRSPSIELKPFSSADVAWDLFYDAWTTMAAVRKRPGDLRLSKPQFTEWLNISSSHSQPLIIIAFALNLLYDETATKLTRFEILMRLIARERSRLSDGLKTHNVQLEGALLLVAMAAIPGSISSSEINDMRCVTAPPGLIVPSALEMRRTPLWKNEFIRELQPDVLASFFFYSIVTEMLGDSRSIGEWSWKALTIGHGSKEELARRLTRLGHLSMDRPRQKLDEAAMDPVIDALAIAISADPEKSLTIYETTGTRRNVEWPLLPLVVAAARSEALKYRSLSEEDYLVYAPSLGATLNDLSVRLSEIGDIEGALQAINESVSIFERLSPGESGDHASQLASALNNQSNRLAEQGIPAMFTQAVTSIRRAVNIRAKLAEADFARHGADYAVSMNNLSNRLAEGGDRQGSLNAVRESVRIAEKLPHPEYESHAQVLAEALMNLSIRIAQAKEQGGLDASRRAVAIYKGLSDGKLAAHARPLALSLNNWASDLREAGRESEALNVTRQSVEILEIMAHDNFKGYGPLLAATLSNYGPLLLDAGKRELGAGCLYRSASLFERLLNLDTSRANYLTAECLESLAFGFIKIGDTAKAIEMLRSAAGIVCPHAQSNSSAQSLHEKLSLILSELLSHSVAGADMLVRMEPSRQNVEKLLRSLNFRVCTDELSNDEGWAIVVTPPGRVKVISIARGDRSQNSTMLQMIMVLDDVQKEKYKKLDVADIGALSTKLNDGMVSGGSNYELFDHSTLSRDDQLGRCLFRVYEEVPDALLTSRALLDAIAACFQTFEVGEKIMVDNLGEGTRNRVPVKGTGSRFETKTW